MSVTAVQVNPAEAGAKLISPFAGAVLTAGDTAKGAGTATACVQTWAADPARPLVISQLVWGFDGTPAAGATITLADGTNGTVFQMPVTTSGLQQFTFVPPRCSTPGATLAATLSSGGGTVTGYVWGNVYTEK